MADKAPAFKFTTNVPVNTHIRFIDVRPGKLWTDPKGVQKMLPAQVSIKGTFDGVDTICFLPGPAWKNIKALADGGVIDADGMEVGLTAANDESLAANVSVPVRDGKVTAVLSKPAGERYEAMSYTLHDAPAKPASKRLPPPSKVIPGLDDLPDAGLGAMDAMSYERQTPPPNDNDAPEWVTEHSTPAKPSGVAPNAAKKAAYINAYIDLLGYVRANSGLKDEVAIQAATATLHIGLKQEGLR